jgi:hypothetical protein
LEFIDNVEVARVLDVQSRSRNHVIFRESLYTTS